MKAMKQAMIYLSIAIVFESFGTTMLKLSEGFTVVWASIGVIVGFLISFTSLSFALKKIALSTAYAIWSGVGTAFTALIGVFLFQEHMSLMKAIALILIILGIVIMNKSKSEEEPVAASANG